MFIIIFFTFVLGAYLLFAQNLVPLHVTLLGSSNHTDGVPTGANTEMQVLQQLMSLQLA